MIQDTNLRRNVARNHAPSRVRQRIECRDHEYPPLPDLPSDHQGELSATKPSSKALFRAIGGQPRDTHEYERHYHARREKRRLFFATIEDDRGTILRLAQLGADLDVLYADRQTLLHVAANYGCSRAVHALIEVHARVDIQDVRGDTPLHLAARHGNLNVTRSLIRRGANVNASNVNGDTPLHVAAFHGIHDVVEELVDHGADVRLRNGRDMTPRQVAKSVRNVAVAAILSLVERDD